jgi:hypothetical protein
MSELVGASTLSSRRSLQALRPPVPCPHGAATFTIAGHPEYAAKQHVLHTTKPAAIRVHIDDIGGYKSYSFCTLLTEARADCRSFLFLKFTKATFLALQSPGGYRRSEEVQEKKSSCVF